MISNLLFVLLASIIFSVVNITIAGMAAWYVMTSKLYSKMLEKMMENMLERFTAKEI